MNIQEQLEKIEGEFGELLENTSIEGGYDYDKEDSWLGRNEATDRLKLFLHTSALKLLKTAYEEERERLEKSLENDDAEKPEGEDLEYDYKLCRLVGRNQAKEHTITHLNTKIAEVNELMK